MSIDGNPISTQRLANLMRAALHRASGAIMCRSAIGDSMNLTCKVIHRSINSDATVSDPQSAIIGSSRRKEFGPRERVARCWLIAIERLIFKPEELMTGGEPYEAIRGLLHVHGIRRGALFNRPSSVVDLRKRRIASARRALARTPRARRPTTPSTERIRFPTLNDLESQTEHPPRSSRFVTTRH